MSTLAAVNNFTRLIAAGKTDVPDPSTFWVGYDNGDGSFRHPTSAEMKAAIVSPFLNDPGGDGVCTRRLFTRAMTSSNVDGSLVSALTEGDHGPFEIALQAWYRLEVDEDTASYNTLMATAKSKFLSGDDSVFKLIGRSNCHVSQAAVLALDAIPWSDMDEFEAAFARVLDVMRADGGGGAFPETTTTSGTLFNYTFRGYWFNDMVPHSKAPLVTTLALVGYNVNSGGVAHTYSDGILDDVGPEVEASDPHRFSPIHMANVNSCLSVSGGIMMGHRNGPISSYEAYYMSAIYTHCLHFDHATNFAWNLTGRCLLGRNRSQTAFLEEDEPVKKVRVDTTGIVETTNDVILRMYDDGLLRWVNERSVPGGTGGSAETCFRFLAGPLPAIAAPASQTFAGQRGGRFYYKQDQSNPDTGLRFDTTNLHHSYGRYPFDNRVFFFAFNSVGLAPLAINRMVHLPAYSNGVHLSEFDNTDQPHITTSTAFWRYAQDSHEYWRSSGVARNPTVVAEDEKYIMDLTTFSESGGVYTWTYDYTDRLSTLSAIGIDGKVTLAQMTMTLDPGNQRLTIDDVIECDNDIYIGWHFSPNLEPTYTADGFTISDGADTVQVSITPQNGFTLDRTTRTDQTGGNPFLARDGAAIPNDDMLRFGDNRSDHNVGYTPTATQARYETQVVVEANPSGGPSIFPPVIEGGYPESETEITLEYDVNPTNVTSVSIMRSETSGGALTNVSGSVPIANDDYTDTTVTPAQNYWYKIRATGAAGFVDSAEFGPLVTTATDTIRPTITSASIDTTGMELSLLFTEAVTGTTVPTITASGGAVTGVLIPQEDSTVIVYALSRAVLRGEVVTITFGTNDIQDTAGNNLAAVTDLAVSNGSFVEPAPDSSDVITVATPPRVISKAQPARWTISLRGKQGQMIDADEDPDVIIEVNGEPLASSVVVVEKVADRTGLYDCILSLPDSIVHGQSIVGTQRAKITQDGETEIREKVWTATVIEYAEPPIIDPTDEDEIIAGVLGGLASSGTVKVVSAIAQDGTSISVIRGDDYKGSRKIVWTGESENIWPDLTDAVLKITVTSKRQTFSFVPVVESATGTQSFSLELSKTETLAFNSGRFAYDVQATLSSDDVRTLVRSKNWEVEQTYTDPNGP